MLNESIGNGNVVDVGGQWIGPGQDRMYALAAEAAIETFRPSGKNLLELGGKVRRYTGTIPRLGPHILLDIARATKAQPARERGVGRSPLGSLTSRRMGRPDHAHVAERKRPHAPGQVAIRDRLLDCLGRAA